jgi:hypothetical protein
LTIFAFKSFSMLILHFYLFPDILESAKDEDED